MNFFAKKFLGAAAFFQLAVAAGLAQTTMNLGSLPLWFEANHGQADATASFVTHGRDSEFLISSAGAQLILRDLCGKIATARMEFVGADPAAPISGGAEMSGKINYLLGNDPAQWQSGVPTFGRVLVTQIYPGINVVYYGNQERLEYDFDLAAGVKPETIVIRFAGAEKVSVNPQGELVVKLAGREIIQHQPVAYQISSGARREVTAGYKILDARTVAFAVGSYNHGLPLVIDPVLSFSTFFGGNNADAAWAIALNPNDNSIYIAGQTLSTQISNNIPLATSGAYQTNFQGGTQIGDAFVARFDNTGSNLLYCTYLGGNQSDVAYAIAVDGAGDAFVTGGTLSTNFPVKNAVTYGNYSGTNISGQIPNIPGAQQVHPWDVFVTELNPSGSGLVYSTYLGGGDVDVAYGITLDPATNAFITGITYSTNFPVTAGAFQPLAGFTNSLYTAHANAFVAEIAADGGPNSLKYSTYLGGTNYDVGRAISFNNGYLAVAGYTASTNFPATNFVYQPFVQPPFLRTNRVDGVKVITNNFYDGSILNGSTNKNVTFNTFNCDAFVAEFVADGGDLDLRYATLLGGTNNDFAYGVAVDSAGNADVVGGTTSYNFPDTTNALNLTSYTRTNGVGNSLTNAFLTQVQWSGSNAWIGYSQIFGGGSHEQAQAVALDAVGNVFITGSSLSGTNVTATPGNLFGSLTNRSAGLSDVFVTVFKADFSALLYSAYFGGKNNDYGNAIAVDADDNAYVAGQTFSGTGFPVFNAKWTARNGLNDAFLVKIIPNATLPALNIDRSGTNGVVSWLWSPVPMQQISSNSFSLATATNLLSTNWTAVKPPVTQTNNVYTYTFGLTNPARFFRFNNN